MQALMLAAGMGSRLAKFTQNNTKCMVEVAGIKLIDRAIQAVQKAGIKKFIIVVGYQGQNLINYIEKKYNNSVIDFVFINNKDYATSNNIYSFYLAKEYLESDDTLLLESDLIYEESLIQDLMNQKEKNLVVVAKYKNWMDGTVITKDTNENITAFIEKKNMDNELLDIYYKTVNIYKFSKEFCKNIYLPALENHMANNGLNSYYETPLKNVVIDNPKILKSYDVKQLNWYEIDNEQDLNTANQLFGK